MTLVFDSEKKCAVCGKPSVQYEIVSTNRFGSPDLDTRPPEMERSTIDYWIQRCPHCNYCNSDIEKYKEGAKELIIEEGYKNIINDKDYPELANSFRCQSYINKKLNSDVISAWAMIHAAWVCDDENNNQAAKMCRINAYELIKKVWEAGIFLMKENGGDYVLAVDLLRRSEQYEQASEFLVEGFDSHPDDFILELLSAEKKLIDKKIDVCYTMEEAGKLVKDGL